MRDVLSGVWLGLQSLVLLFAGASCHHPVGVRTGPYTDEEIEHSMRHWGEKPMRIVVEPFPECMHWAVIEGLKVLNSSTSVSVEFGSPVTPELGEVLFVWGDPRWAGPRAKAATSLSVNRETLEVESSVTTMQDCDVRTTAHELGHSFGLLDKDAPGDLMHWTYPTGGWRLSSSEEKVLRPTK